MRRAAVMRHREAIPLLVGCPETVASDCSFTRDRVTRLRDYTEPPPRSELRRTVRDQIDEL